MTNRIRGKSLNVYMVGVTGLEPATSRPPAVRASQLRYTPKLKKQLGDRCNDVPGKIPGGLPHANTTVLTNIGSPLR